MIATLKELHDSRGEVKEGKVCKMREPGFIEVNFSHKTPSLRIPTYSVLAGLHASIHVISQRVIREEGR